MLQTSRWQTLASAYTTPSEKVQYLVYIVLRQLESQHSLSDEHDFRKHLNACVAADGEHFEHTM